MDTQGISFTVIDIVRKRETDISGMYYITVTELNNNKVLCLVKQPPLHEAQIRCRIHV